MPDISGDTRDYERWLARRVRVVPADLRLKHVRMREDPHTFLRATFYRWLQRWPEACGSLDAAPMVLGIGDLHVENFGTWRDADGRLVWGVNDFDDAGRAPYPADLVRLATSAWLAADAGRVDLKPKRVCEALLEGYARGVREGGRAFVLAEHNGWLREVVDWQWRSPAAFWKKLQRRSEPSTAVPDSVHSALRALMPERGIRYVLRRRIAGLGSLGRPRYVALAPWRGGWIAREVRALAPSTWAWANAGRVVRYRYDELNRRGVRSPDPFLRVRSRWVVRRLAPDCTKLDLAALPRRYDEYRLLFAMGYETANVHLGTRGARAAIRADLRRRERGWLRGAARVMREAVIEDWSSWTRHR